MGTVSLQQGNETHASGFNPVSAGKQDINHPNRYAHALSVISYQDGSDQATILPAAHGGSVFGQTPVRARGWLVAYTSRNRSTVIRV